MYLATYSSESRVWRDTATEWSCCVTVGQKGSSNRSIQFLLLAQLQEIGQGQWLQILLLFRLIVEYGCRWLLRLFKIILKYLSEIIPVSITICVDNPTSEEAAIPIWLERGRQICSILN